MEAGSLRDELAAQLVRLRPAVAKLRLMTFGPELAAPMTQYRGAVRQAREALNIVRSRTGGAIQRWRQQELDAAREGVDRRADAATAVEILEKAAKFQTAFNELAGEKGRIDQAIARLEGELAQAQTLPAAFSVLLQRPSATGSINLYEVNELEPKPEQEPDLQKLVRLGGHNTYGSPDLAWVAEATDVIEAAPLSIYERLVEVDGRNITLFEVDQEGLEQTVRQMADPWARNIEQTMDSEHAVLARRAVVESDPTLAEKARQYRESGSTEEGAILRVVREAGEPVQQQTARVAAWLAREFERRVEQVEAMVESRWKEKEFIDRLEALARVLPKPAEIIKSVRRASEALDREAQRLLPAVLAPRRERPAFHMLTTEAPGLVEGFIQVVLEEEMALRNVLAGEGKRRGRDYEAEVRERINGYRARISALAERVVEEFGYGVIVDNLQRQGRSRDKALQKVMDDNLTLREELVHLAVLAEAQEAQQKAKKKKYTFDANHPDHPLVETILQGGQAADLRKRAEQETAENNRFDPALKDLTGDLSQAIEGSELLRKERDQRLRSLARREALAQLSRQNPGWQLESRARSWWRQHTALAQTTARREVVAAHGLHARMMDPRTYYGSGAVYQRSDGRFAASGRRKRYDLIYAPSRVNLARGERESVEVYPQWVGVTDPLSARRAHRVYSLINESVQVRLIKEAETLKVSENERTALVRAVANTQAYFTQSLGFGDPEDLSYQFNLRGGLPAVAMKEGESFQPGPTAGYCIPKDPLFKLFRHALTDAGKLTQIGIPAHLQPVLIQMAAEIESRRDDFDSEGEFEQWVMNELLTQEGLRRWFKPAGADAVQKALTPYIEVTGGLLLFHVTKLHEILGNLGRPSLLASRGQDLGLFLWSQWAGEKVTLGGEQVNRATVAQITSDVFHLREEAQRRNPNANVAAENKMRVWGYGPYKGDPDRPSPPDVRDSAGGRLFMDLSDMGEYVVHSLDEEGQTIWRANRYGLRLDSDEPDDLRVTRLLAEEFLGVTETDVRRSGWYLAEWRNLAIPDPQQFMQAEANLLLQGYAQILRGLRDGSDPRIAALQTQFPGHGTVGDITITVVPGVSTDDFLGFKVDAKTALSEAADEVQALLIAAGGISLAQMQANAQLRRPLDQWIPLTDLPSDQREKLVAEIGGRIHPLALRLRGPGTEFRQDLQGQDVVVFFTVHPDVLALNPAELRDLMLVGRPNSALAVRDGSVQGRHRVWFDREVMLWYAAGRGVDPQGRIIRDWSRRDTEGRQSVYASFGVGDKSWKPLLGTDLREEVVRQEHRAMALYAALQKVANASAGELADAVQEAEQVYQRELPRPQMALEAGMAAEYQQMVQGKGVDRPRDEIIRGHLQELAEGLSLRAFTPVHWLSTGGSFLLNGAPEDQQTDVLKVLTRAQERIRSSTAAQAAGSEELPRTLIRQLIVPQLKPEAMQASERQGKMFSVKASEEQAERAVAKLAALQAEAVRQGALAQREKGFRTVSTLSEQDPLEQSRLQLQKMAEQIPAGGSADNLHQSAGEVLGWTLQALRKVNEQLLSGDPKKKEEVDRQISALTDGRELNPRAIRRFTGTYEDPGIFALWFEQAGEAGREKVASAVELFTVSLALEKVTPFLGQPADQVNESEFWRALAEFYAETIDDHYHEYNPWAYDPKRGSGFSDFYDKLGTLKPERAEELYGLAWRHSRALYGFLRELAVSKTSLARIPEGERDLLLGRVTLGETAGEDQVTVQAIGAGASEPEELKWRAYNQLREMAFLRNDGFQWPVVFEQIDPDDPEILDARRRVNFTFMAPLGRTHYSRALMEGPALGENLFITRNGRMATPAGANRPVLQIDDAQFWMSEAEYRRALIGSKRMAPDAADRQIEADRKSGRLVPKGIRAAARFQKPVTVGSVVPMHHHPLIPALGQSGYPYTDKSDVHFDITYDKSLYPDIFNPGYRTGVLLPPEIDWRHEETVQAGSREAAVPKIREWLRPFAREHGTLIAKGSAESGARNFQRFDLLDSQDRIAEERLTAAAEFIYEVSKGQNVTVQRMVLTTPITWMDPSAVGEFVNRQVRDWGVAVNLETHPKSWVYGTARVILSSGVPGVGQANESGLFNPANWRVAHRISLNSLQAATNVGRGGTLEILTPEMVRPEFRDRFIPELEEAGRRVMVALARYGKKYWDEVYVPGYRREHGADPVEFDASGVPYWWPRYMMLDLIPEPVWARDGVEVGEARLIDVIPGDPARGTPSRFLLRTPDGQEFDGEILGFKFWLLEPNIGIGLWPNYWRRELVHEQARAKAEGGRPVDWSRVGEADRVVLNDYLLAGEGFLNARFGGDYFGGGPHRRPVTDQRGPAPDSEPPAVPEAPADPFQQALSAVRGIGVPSIGPAEASLVLVEAGLRALGGRAALAGQEPESVLGLAAEWLNPEQIGARFPQGAGISVSGAQVAEWLRDSAHYRTRIGELILDRVLSEPLAPPVAVLPGRLTREEAKRFLPASSTFAVVTGKRALMNHHLYPFEVAKGGRPVNVIGVNSEWLGSESRALRLMVLNPETGRYYLEFGLLEPVPISRAFIVELLSDGEVPAHEALTDALTSDGVQVVNPAGEAQRRADNKYWLRKNAVSADIDVPFSVVVPRNVSSGAAGQALLDSVADRSPSGVVIQPSADTTEGAGVRWFPSDDKTGPIGHVGQLALAGDSLVSSFRAKVTVSGRPLVLRVNVSNGQAASASAIVGKAGEKIASLGQGGEVIPLGQALSQLRNPDGADLPITEQDWERIEAAAESAARAVGLPLAGIDIVLDQAAGALRPVVIEANARPGLLIFGERVSFPADGPITSRSAAPAGPAFWKFLGVEEEPPQTAGAEEQRAITLREWQQILADPVGSGFWEILKNRYGEEETDLHQALAAYQQLVMGALASGFDPSQKIVVVVASPGRDRVFMGHTDSPGLGGFTINVATEEEVLAVLQATEDGQVHLKNSDPAYPEVAFPMEEIRQEAQKHTDRAELLSKPKKIWDAARWESYLKAALTFMVAQMPSVDPKIGSSGLRLYVSSVGPRALPATGGVSSSSALTGTISVAMNALFKLGLSLEQLAEVDYGEYLLDKSAGAGDKAAQLFAKRGEVGVVNSFPDSFREAVKFPKGLTVLMAESPIPRLSSSDGLDWLRGNDPDHADAVYAWAKQDIMRRFGSRAYVRAVQLLKEALADPERARSVGLKEQERRAVLRALEDGYLRELTAGGKIEQELPELAGWENRHLRYHLIYRLLKLLPEQDSVVVKTPMPDQPDKVETLVLDVRKTALYGLAEVERGTAYLLSLRAAVDAQDLGDSAESAKQLKRVLDLVRWAQDGDRATVDHRNGFQPTPWASDPRNDVSDAAIDGWLAGGPELFSIPGGFERSIVDLDEIADEANVKFEGKVAMRVAAAGLGGTMAVHATDEVVAEFKSWIEAKGWKVRLVKAGAPTQVIAPPKIKVPAQFQPEGKDVVVKGESSVTLLEPLQLPNGSWLLPEGGTILLRPGVRIGPFVVITAGSGSRVALDRDVVVKERTTVEGEVSVLKGSQLWGVVRGHPAAPTILGPGTRMLDPAAFIDHGVITVPVQDEKGKTHGVSIYDARIGEEAGRGPVVIWGGTDLRKGVTVRPNSILGPFAHLGPGSEAKATVWMGASADKNDSAFAHRGYGGNLVAIPVYLDGTPLEEAWHEQLLERLAALRFGRVVSREVERAAESGPESRPRLNLVMDLDGKQIPLSVRGINFGDEAGASNFKAISGGRKAIGVISAGTVAGVTAKVQAPVFVGPDSLVDNGALVSGLQAAQPGTYVRPVGTAIEKAIRPGAVRDLQGKSKGAEEFRLFLSGLRTLQTLARVSVIGLKRSAGPRDVLLRAALRAEVRALKGHFDEIDAYTAKELELLGKSPDADQVPVLATQAQALRAGWPEILKALEKGKKTTAAGTEEVPQFTVFELEDWARRLSSEDSLYGWITRLPVDERTSLLETISRAYGTFGPFMRQVAELIVERRTKAQVQEKLDRSAVTDVEHEVQARIHELVQQFDSMSSIGEEGQQRVPGARFLLLSDPIDGTGSYILERDEPRASHYSSVITIVYRTGDDAWHPVLTLSVSPEFPYQGKRGLWLAAGVGVDGVRVNGQPVSVAAAEGRPLKESVAAFSVLAAAGKEGYNLASALYHLAYLEALKLAGPKEVRWEPDGMAPFLLPLSVEDPGMPTLSLSGPSWDISWLVHIILAMGGQVYRMDQKTPFDLSSASFDDPATGKNPPLLLSASPLAAKTLLFHYVPPVKPALLPEQRVKDLATILGLSPNVPEAVQAAAVLGNLDPSSPSLEIALSALTRASADLDPAIQKIAAAALARLQGAGDLKSAGAEQIPLDEAAAEGTLVVLMPETVERGIGALKVLQGPAGQKVKIAAIVQDSNQREQVSYLLAQADMQLSIRLFNLHRITLQMAKEEILQYAQQAELRVVFIESMDMLRDLGRLLVPQDYWSMWDERVNQKAGLETQM